MIEAGWVDGSSIFRIRSVGVQSVPEFGTYGGVLLRSGIPSRVLFDWTVLTDWREKDHFVDACRGWSEAAAVIDRAAGLHERRWLHQAAVLTAVLRSAGADSRCWASRDAQSAITWLTRDGSVPIGIRHR